MNGSNWIGVVLLVLVMSAGLFSKPKKQHELPAVENVAAVTDQSDQSEWEVLTQVAKEAPKLEHRAEANAGAGAMPLEPPPSAAGPISYPVQAEAAATPIPALPVPKTVTQPVRTTYGQYYSCGPNGCSVVYPTRVQPQQYYQRRSVFRRW